MEWPNLPEQQRIAAKALEDAEKEIRKPYSPAPVEVSCLNQTGAAGKVSSLKDIESTKIVLTP